MISPSYTVHRSKRAKRISITIKQEGNVVVTLPFRASEYAAQKFVQQKSAWIVAMQEKLKKQFENKTIVRQSKKDFLEKKHQALTFVTLKARHFNMFYQFIYKDIKVGNQKSRWGSCSARGNLNFNYSLIYLPEHLADYIVVHELCHLKEMNHGRGFWNLVAKVVPDYKERRLELKKKFINVQ